MTASRQAGFTLMEVMVAVAIVGLLSTRAIYSASVQQKKARRTEVTMGLDALEKAQRAYFLEYGQFASNFDQMEFGIDGGTRINANTLKAQRYTYVLSQPWGVQSYYCIATGQIDNDGFLDAVVLEAGRP